MAGHTISNPLIAEGILRDIEEAGDYVVVIFNNPINTMEEVIAVLMHATECDMQEAALETWEAHTYGTAKVHFSTQFECEHVARMIAMIGVTTEVRKEAAYEPA